MAENEPVVDDIMTKDYLDDDFNSYDRGIGRQLRSIENKAQCRNLMVHNVPRGLTKEGFSNVFSQFGSLTETSLNIETKQGFVEFVSPKDAFNTICTFEATPIYNMRVQYCLPQSEYWQKKNKESREKKEMEKKREEKARKIKEEMEQKMIENSAAGSQKEERVKEPDMKFPEEVNEEISAFLAKQRLGSNVVDYDHNATVQLENQYKTLSEAITSSTSQNTQTSKQETKTEERPKLIFRAFCQGDGIVHQRVLKIDEAWPEYEAFVEVFYSNPRRKEILQKSIEQNKINKADSPKENSFENEKAEISSQESEKSISRGDTLSSNEEDNESGTTSFHDNCDAEVRSDNASSQEGPIIENGLPKNSDVVEVVTPMTFRDTKFSILESRMFVEISIVAFYNYNMFFIRKVKDEPLVNEMDLKLNQYCSSRPVDKYKPGIEEICAIYNKEAESWQRALILGIKPENCKVLTIDHGITMPVAFEFIRPLSSELALLPIYALPSSLGLMPPQNFSDWTEEQTEVFAGIYENKKLFALRHGPKIKLFNQIILKNHENSYLGDYLIKNHSFRPGPHYFKPLRCEDFEATFPESQLTIGTKYTVEITDVSDIKVNVCLTSTLERYKELMDLMAEEYKEASAVLNEQLKYEPGEIVAARVKRAFFRGKIWNKVGVHDYMVEDIDTGSCSRVKRNNIYLLTAKFAKVAPCSFSIKPYIPSGMSESEILEDLEALVGEQLEIEVVDDNNVVKLYHGSKCFNQ